MNVFIDVESLPDQSEGAIDRYLEGIKVKCPHSTKDLIGADLGMDSKEIKFTGKAELEAMWIEKFGKSQAATQANEKWLKTSFSGDYGSICAIVINVNDKELKFNIADFDGNESDLLTAFWVELENELNKRPPYFIAHNAKFDLPFLWKRSVITNNKPLPFKPNGKHGSDFYCTMEAWAGFKGMISMDNLAKILGIEGKGGMSGADVWPEFQKGNTTKILEYCADDVRILKEVYNRLTFG